MLVQIFAAVAVAVIVYLIWQDNGISINNIMYENKKIPREFDGFKIVQISDLHNKKFGENEERLLNKIREVSPDIIVITGDLIDRRRYDLDTALMFICGAKEIAPIYYVAGNHEGWSKKYEQIEKSLKNAGVNVVNNDQAEIKIGNGQINIMGLLDPSFWAESYQKVTDVSKMEEYLKSLPENDGFRITLSHRPELIDLYAKYKLDLVFSGHAHGGQFRLPFIGGLYAPSQGVFPKYTSGAHKKGNTTMIVSRGLGNSKFPIRLNNRPEVVVATLKAKNNQILEQKEDI